MNILEEYIAYLKDNPEGYWFKCKLHGIGWMPATIAGWSTLAAYLAFVFALVLFVPAANPDEVFPIIILGPIIAATILLLIVAWRTGEPLKWHWGSGHKKD